MPDPPKAENGQPPFLAEASTIVYLPPLPYGSDFCYAVCMKKVVYIIPGYGESHLKQKGYNKIAEMFKGSGITPIHVDIDWHVTKFVDFELFSKQLIKKFNARAGEEVYVLGFSFGAIIAFLTASQTYPAKLILCSLSPYFRQDLKKLKPAWQRWWNKVGKSDLDFDILAKKVKAEIYLIAGDQESEAVLRRARSARRKLAKSHLFFAKGAKHNIGQKEYLVILEKLIKKL
jgi:hypothetical protein